MISELWQIFCLHKVNQRSLIFTSHKTYLPYTWYKKSVISGCNICIMCLSQVLINILINTLLRQRCKYGMCVCNIWSCLYHNLLEQFYQVSRDVGKNLITNFSLIILMEKYVDLCLDSLGDIWPQLYIYLWHVSKSNSIGSQQCVASFDWYLSSVEGSLFLGTPLISWRSHNRGEGGGTSSNFR